MNLLSGIAVLLIPLKWANRTSLKLATLLSALNRTQMIAEMDDEDSVTFVQESRILPDQPTLYCQ